MINTTEKIAYVNYGYSSIPSEIQLLKQYNKPIWIDKVSSYIHKRGITIKNKANSIVSITNDRSIIDYAKIYCRTLKST